jgi:hypothetical protein
MTRNRRGRAQSGNDDDHELNAAVTTIGKKPKEALDPIHANLHQKLFNLRTFLHTTQACSVAPWGR